MRHAFAGVLEIADLELAQLVAPQRVEQQRRQDRAVALGLERIGRRRRQQFARLVVADRRRLAFGGFRLRPLDPFDRIVGNGVPAAQIFEQRGQRREPVPDGAAAEPALHQLVAPRDDVRARDGAKFLRPHNSGKAPPCCMDRWRGRTQPDPCSGSCEADVLRAPEIEHSVQHVGRDGHLARLTLVRLEAQPITDDALPSRDIGFHESTAVVP